MENNNQNGTRSLKGYLISIIITTVFLILACLVITLIVIIDVMVDGKTIELALLIPSYLFSLTIIWSLWAKYNTINKCRCNCGYNFKFPEDVKMRVKHSYWEYVYRKHEPNDYRFNQDVVFECKCKLCGATKIFEETICFRSDIKYNIPNGVMPKQIYEKISHAFKLDDEFDFEIKDIPYDDSVKYDKDNNVIE